MNVNRTHGFGMVEGLLVIAVIAVAGVLAIVYVNRQNAPLANTPATTQQKVADAKKQAIDVQNELNRIDVEKELDMSDIDAALE